MDELKQLLLQVPDSYDGFVIGVQITARDYPDRLDDVVNYLKEHRDMGTSDILKWIWEDVEGIDLNAPTKLELVDDDEIEDE